jgi:molybdopterin-guanine dinucleotide biosynthesis protein
LLEIRLGIAGTAKNTGKTTATAAIIQELRTRGVGFYLTSIGYDGENIDNVTGLPKPKLRVEPGDVVATAERCLAVSTAKLSTPRIPDF